MILLLKTEVERKQMRPNATFTTRIVPDMICVTMSIISGAIYLDLTWSYNIRKSSVYKIFRKTLEAWDKV